MAHRVSAAITALLIAALLALLPACGSSGSAQPSGIPFTPDALADSESFTIAAILSTNSPYLDQTQKDMDYLQELLKQRGWNIRLKVTAAKPDAGTGSISNADVLQAAASGGSLADGYRLWPMEAKSLADSGLVKNVSGLVRNTAPVLYDRCRVYFESDGSGVPMNATRPIWGTQTVLYLKKGIAEGLAGQQMSVARLFSLMEKDDSLKIGFSGFSMNCVTSALNVWAREHGYYPLDLFSVHGELYAAMDDMECVPVPVESIAGFEEVFRQALRFSEEGRLFALWDTGTYGEDASGYVETLSRQMDPVFLIKTKTSGKDYLAFPLPGTGVPQLPEGDPYIFTVLAVPVLSGMPEQVVKFASWAQTTQDGYDLISYGAVGMDYRLAGSRIEILNKGKEMVREDWDPSVSTAYFFRKPLSVFSESLDRVTVYAAENYESLAGSLQPAEFPILKAKRLLAPFYPGENPFRGISDEYGDTIGMRLAYLSGSVYEENRGRVPGDADQCLAALKAKEQDTARLAEAYRDRIRQLLQEDQG